MKKEYIQPQTEKIQLNLESNLLNSSFIEVGGGTDNFDSPRMNEDGFDETWETWEDYPEP